MKTLFTNLLIISFLYLSFIENSSKSNYQETEFFNDNNFVNIIDINSLSDSSSQKKNHRQYGFKNFNNLDSLLKNFRGNLDLEKFFKEFDENFKNYWRDLPKFDRDRFNEFFRELEKDIKSDSLLKRFKYFRQKNLLDESELTEI